MLTTRSLGIIAATGGQHMQMGMIVPIAAMGVEDRDLTTLERLPLDRAVKIVEALRPAAYERTQYDRGVRVKGCAAHRRHRQDDMPINDAFVEPPADLADPVVHGDFGAAQAQGGCAAHCHPMLPLTTVQTAVFDVAHLRGGATGKHLAHQLMVIGGLIPRMGVLKRLPVIGKDLLKDTPGPCGGCQHPSPPSEEVEMVVGPWLYHVSSALSTPPQRSWGLLHRCDNCLQIKHKK